MDALRSFLRCALACAMMAMSAAPARAASASSLEYPIKATFLNKFGDFITWPAEAAQPPAFNICVLGDDPFGPVIDQALRGKAMQGRPMALVRVRDTAAASTCQILYIGKTGDTAAVLTALAGRPVLPVTAAVSWSGPARRIIHFTVSDNRVRFIIDDAAAAAAGLAISSKLLAVAISVNPRPKAGTP